MSQKTHFGAREVEASEKARLVAGVFSSVASKYDIMNDAMSFGIHRIWKDRLIKEINPNPDSKLLDVAGGTGDIAFRFLKAGKGCTVEVCDINPDMLAEGKKRSIDKNILQGISWTCADAQKLPFENNSFDYYTIAFGIRNVTFIEKALAEAYRVLKPGGRFLCLEFSQVENEILTKSYDFFSFNIIPKMGKIIAGDEDSYKYLVESIRRFPNQEKFAGMIANAGFDNIRYFNLTGGVAAIHSGWKI